MSLEGHGNQRLLARGGFRNVAYTVGESAALSVFGTVPDPNSKPILGNALLKEHPLFAPDHRPDFASPTFVGWGTERRSTLVSYIGDRWSVG